MATNPSSSSHCAHDNQPKLKSILCTWKPTQVQVHIVHMETNPSSSSYCAHGSQFEIFESLLFPYINDLFLLGFYCIDVIRSMYYKIDTL